MKILSELAALHIGRRTSFRLILIGEIILLCAGICGLFGRNAVYEYDMSAAKVNFGTYSNEYEGILGGKLGGTRQYGRFLRNQSARRSIPHTPEIYY